MRAYVCVYRHMVPSPSAWAKTESAADSDPMLADYLASYRRDGNCLDWGDDPSFFAASKVFGTARAASWGVCRRDVRAKLAVGDFVVWFCAREDANARGHLDYFFIGCATVGAIVSRVQLWRDRRFSAYTGFYNTLAKPSRHGLVQHETIHNYHRDWEQRAAAAYIVFDACQDVTALNLSKPLLVARKEPKRPTETWLSPSSARVRRLEKILFADLEIQRRLRTTHPQRPHRHIRLDNAPVFTDVDPIQGLTDLRAKLLRLAREIGAG